jgi:peptidoglycan hydrolase-like protein with peptidoglycan-binding domain
MYACKKIFLASLALVLMVNTGVSAQSISSSVRHPICSVVGEHAFGEKSDDVKAIQSFLTMRGYTTAVTGDFTAETGTALRQFQTAYAADILTQQGLTVAPGVWDIYTAMKARELVCGAVVVPVVTPTTSVVSTPAQISVPAPLVVTPAPLVCIAFEIEPGVKNSNDVKSIQRWLMSQGYNKVRATGEYGSATKRAIVHFQKEYAADILVPAGLTKATGIWGERTAAHASRLGLCVFDTEDEDVAARTVDGGTGVSGDVIPERSAFTPTVPVETSVTTHTNDVAEAENLEEIYPGVCLPKTIGPIGTQDARGNTVAQVKMLQRFLISRGYTKVEVSGVYGPTTQRAVAHFQNENKQDILEPAGLTKATGIWGIRTAIKASEVGLCDFK